MAPGVVYEGAGVPVQLISAISSFDNPLQLPLGARNKLLLLLHRLCCLEQTKATNLALLLLLPRHTYTAVVGRRCSSKSLNILCNLAELLNIR